MMTKLKEHDHDEVEAVSGSVHEIVDDDGPIWVNKFTEDSARAFVKQLQYQSRQDPVAPIIVYIDSFGGDVYALLTMIAAMESVPNQIITCAFSKAMSAGAMLLACGDVRYATEHSTLMIHEISAGTLGHIDDINTQHLNLTKLNDKLMKLLAKKCDLQGGVTALKKKLANSRDLYFSPEEAIKFGLIDKIGVPTLFRSVNLQHVVTSNPRGEHVDKKSTKD